MAHTAEREPQLAPGASAGTPPQAERAGAPPHAGQPAPEAPRAGNGSLAPFDGPARASLRERLDDLRRRIARLPGVARSVRTALHVASGLKNDPITLRAAALTYLTVLSLIPLLVVVFSLFQAVVGKREIIEQLQAYILQNLGVGLQERFSSYVQSTIARAGGAALGSLGFVGLLVSAISLLANVEAAFNHTFRAPRPRPLALRFGIYWCLLTLGPVLLAMSFAGTAMLASTRVLAFLGPVLKVALALTPVFVTIGSFTLLYLILPAVPVRRRAAVVGAFVAGVAWEIAKIAYAWASATILRKDALYGSLSAIPVFLLWTYVSWVIVLFGARVAYAIQSPHAEPTADVAGAPLGRELLAARVMRSVAHAFCHGLPAPTTQQLALAFGLSDALVRGTLETLETAGLTTRLAAGGWVPARSAALIRLSDVRQAVRGRTPPRKNLEPALDDLVLRWSAADEAAARELDATLEELVREPARA